MHIVNAGPAGSSQHTASLTFVPALTRRPLWSDSLVPNEASRWSALCELSSSAELLSGDENECGIISWRSSDSSSLLN